VLSAGSKVLGKGSNCHIREEEKKGVAFFTPYVFKPVPL